MAQRWNRARLGAELTHMHLHKVNQADVNGSRTADGLGASLWILQNNMGAGHELKVFKKKKKKEKKKIHKRHAHQTGEHTAACWPS